MEICVTFSKEDDHEEFMKGLSKGFKILTDVCVSEGCYQFNINRHALGGRKAKLNDAAIEQLFIMRETGMSCSQLAEYFNTSKATISKYLNKNA